MNNKHGAGIIRLEFCVCVCGISKGSLEEGLSRTPRRGVSGDGTREPGQRTRQFAALGVRLTPQVGGEDQSPAVLFLSREDFGGFAEWVGVGETSQEREDAGRGRERGGPLMGKLLRRRER
jgi:hypothetical protein